MTAVSIKKLVAGFLVLASALVASSFLFQDTQDVLPQTAAVSDQIPETSVITNAFVESLPADAPGNYRTAQNLLSAETVIVTSSDNLTEKLVAVLGDELGKANPNGPNATAGLALPNTDGIVNALTNPDDLAALRLPDWESEISFQYKPRLLAGANPADIAAYQKARDEFFRTHLNINTSDDDELSRAVAAQKISLPAALAAVEKIPVPEPLAEYHWSLIKLLAYQERANGLLPLSNTDPLRASLIANVQEKNYFGAVTQYEQKLQRATALGLLLPADNRLALEAGDTTPMIAFMNTLLGIKTAHAIFGIGDIEFHPVELARTIWEWVQKVITEKLKDMLVHKLVTQTITWIQGGGKPQFVTDWKAFIADTAKNQASLTIDRIAPQLCSSFGPLIRVAVTPVDPSRDFSAACSLDQIIGNVQAFADSFENGGWIAYGATLEPSNNFFGSLIQTNELLQQTAAAAKKAKKNEVATGKGLKPQNECLKEGLSQRAQCFDATQVACDQQGLPPDQCAIYQADNCDGMSEEATCEQEGITTPGAVLYGALSDSARAPLERIVNAEDMAALLNALINSALGKLTKLGQSVVSKGLLGIDTKAPYIAPPTGVDDEEKNPNPTLPTIPDDVFSPTSTLETPLSSCGASNPMYIGAVNSAVNDVILSGEGTLVNTGDCKERGTYNNAEICISPRLLNSNGFMDAVATTLSGRSFVAVSHNCAGAYEEVALRKPADNFDENYDIVLGDGTYVRTGAGRYRGCSVPPADTACQ